MKIIFFPHEIAIKVSSRDIRSGVPRDNARCLARRAARRRLWPWLLLYRARVRVSDMLYVETVNQYRYWFVSYEKSPALTQWMSRYDAGMPVGPCTFTLRKAKG